MTHKHTKPFNLEHAKAGAPVGRVDGRHVRIVCWDRIGYNEPIVALSIGNDGCERFTTYANDGKASFVSNDTFLVMLPLGYIDEKPVFVNDKYEFIATYDGDWRAVNYGTVTPKWKLSTACLYRLPKKKVTKEVWQPRLRNGSFEWIGGLTYTSKDTCELAYKPFAGQEHDSFIEAVKTHTYEVEE